MYAVVDKNGNVIQGPGGDIYTNIPDGCTLVEFELWPLINPSEPHLKRNVFWNGTAMELKSESVLTSEANEKNLSDLKKYIYENWLDSGKTQDDIKKKFKSIKKSVSSSKNISDEINTFKKWMEEE